MKPERRGVFLVVAVLLVSAILGGIYGPNVRATTASTDDFQTAVRDFTRVLDVVQANYAEPVDVDKAVYQGAIPGMLRMLDPHSNFFDARQFALLREDQRGKYYGVGMVVAPPREPTPLSWLPTLAHQLTMPAFALATSSSRLMTSPQMASPLAM